MKKIIVLLFATVSVLAVAKPQRGISAADGIEGVDDGDDTAYTAADYIQDGLVCIFDGIENVGWGEHNNDATRWVNLVDNSSIAIRNNNHFGNYYLRINSTLANVLPTKDLINSGSPFTAEVVGFCGSYQSCANIGYQNQISFYFAWGSYCYMFQNGYDGFTISGVGNAYTVMTGTVVYDGTTITFYFPKGRMSKSYNMVWTTQTANSPLSVNDGGTCCLRIYNRVLTEDEIYYNFKVDAERFGL